ncbi:MAG: VanW family protein [Clostridia bacterium]|nr:VanW family protein [Clostridia bacterium]
MTEEESKTKGSKRFFSGADGLLRAAALLLAAGLALTVVLAENGRKKAASPPPGAQENTAFISEAPVEAVFAEGVKVLGADIGGLGLAAAERKLAPLIEARFSAYECRLFGGGKEFLLTKEDAVLGSDLDEVLSEALQGGPGIYEVTVAPEDGPALRERVSEIAEAIDREGSAPRVAEKGAEEGGVAGENGRFVLLAGEDGLRLDRAKTLSLILSGETEIELPVEAVPVSGGAETLPVRRAGFATSFSSASLRAANRAANIEKAASIVNGTVLESGESLSMNALLGERTEENGWLPATAFANGGAETALAPGGGICQVSTTLYNCALLAGLEVPERHGHSRRVSYVEGGRDASLNWGTADLVILNSTSRPIHIFMWADSTACQVGCEIYGEPFPGEYDSIRIETELIETVEPGESEFVADESLGAGDCVLIRSAITGSVYRTYRVFLKDGKELRRETCAETVYPMHPALYAVGGG